MAIQKKSITKKSQKSSYKLTVLVGIAAVVVGGYLSLSLKQNANQNLGAVVVGQNQVVLQKVLLYGGTTTLLNSGARNDVWESADGSTWNQKVTGIAMWTPRQTYGLGESVYFNNKIWAIGGVDASGTYQNDVWASVNGKDWVRMSTNPGWSARITQPVVFNNKLWIIGGGTSNTSLSDIWYSSDGITWTAATVPAAMGSRSMTNPVVFNNQLWLLGGFNASTNTYFNDVWATTNGTNWTQRTTAPWTARKYAGVVLKDNKMWVVGGVSATGRLNDVWSSPDGVTWTQVTAQAQWPAVSGQATYVMNGRIWVAGGYTGSSGMTNAIWSSADGISWTKIMSAIPWTGRTMLQATVVPASFGK